MAKSKKTNLTRSAAGEWRQSSKGRKETRTISAAAKDYISANTASKETARDKLVELGINTASGKLRKNYR